jgi:hypothetical protein
MMVMSSTLRAAALGLACASLILLHPAPALAPAAAKPPARHARRVNRFTSLTGAWSGVYRYPADHPGEPVPFNARLEQNGEALAGQIDEPNTYAHPAAARLYATVSGVCNGLALSFVKQMDGTGGVTHSIYYEGTADAGLTRIDGIWRLSDGCSGAFFMERSGVEAEAAETRSATASGS